MGANSINSLLHLVVALDEQMTMVEQVGDLAFNPLLGGGPLSVGS